MADVKKIALITSTSNFERHKNTIRAIHRKLKSIGGYALYVFTCYGLFRDDSTYDKAEATIYELLNETDFDGCIVEANIGDKDILHKICCQLRNRQIPFITLSFQEENAPVVILNDYSAACQLITHLIVKHDCKKINIVPTSHMDSITQDGIRGYRDTLEKYGIPVEEKRILYKSVTLENGKELVEDFRKVGADDAEAVVCFHDVLSIGFCLELEEQGYKIPDDVLICSLGRSTNSVAFRPDISGVDRMDSALAEKACELLHDMLQGKIVPMVNYSHSEIFFGRSCGCANAQDDIIAKEYQQLVLAKIEVGNQIRQMMQYNDSLDEVSSLEELMLNLKKMFKGLNCPQYMLCLNQGAIDFVCSERDYKYPANGKYYDDEMHVVVGYTERTGDLENIRFPIGQLLPMEVREGDLILLYPVHHIEQIYGYVVFVNEYLPIDLYNYRICHESIASSMENLHRQMILRRSIAMLDQLHMQDALTGLQNRYAWVRFCNDYTEKDAYCVVFMDMDGLKKINDLYGHMAGNVAIKTTAEAIKKVVRENDLLIRYGGDEFQILSSNVDVDYWESIQKIINDEIDRQIMEQKIPYTFGVSYGYCISNRENHLSFEECCNRADELMYADKKARKGCRED